MPHHADEDAHSKDDPDIFVGDLIQWEQGGNLQLETPRRVRAISDDGEWLFIDGSETGIPMSEAILEKKGEGKQQAPSLPLGVGAVPSQTGEREYLRGPLSKEAGYRLIVSGDVGAKELENLISLLTAHKAILA